VPLSKRLFRRALDLFAIAFLAMVGLSTGGQLIEWWRTDPAPPDLSGIPGSTLDWNRVPVTIQFGSATTSLDRIPFTGDRKQLERELERLGKELVLSSEPPKTPADDAERSWLDMLNQEAPLFWESTRGNVYRRLEPLPSFVATQFVEGEEQVQRIVGWGIAFPMSPEIWTIYQFQPHQVRRPASATGRIQAGDVPSPPGSRNVARVADSAGNLWQVVQGRGSLSGWVQHFDHGLPGAEPFWRVMNPASASLKYRLAESVIEIHIRVERDDAITALIWVSREGKPQ